jgi:hypothetical protein
MWWFSLKSVPQRRYYIDTTQILLSVIMVLYGAADMICAVGAANALICWTIRWLLVNQVEKVILLCSIVNLPVTLQIQLVRTEQ